MLIKLRRYIFNRLMGKIRLQELIYLVATAAFLAVLYVSFIDFPSSSQSESNVGLRPQRQRIQHSNGLNERNATNAKIDRDVVAAILVFCAKRPTAIENHLKQLTSLRPSATSFPIIVSQDGDDHLVRANINKYVEGNETDSYLQHKITQPGSKFNYNRISSHYKWALDQAFNHMGYDYVIATEDDLDIAPDFFSYFSWAKQLLTSDKSIWCVSAWNDNGLPDTIDGSKPELVWRTDFFPGLGWMLTRSLWQELRGSWPEAYWDDWMRQPQTRRNRSCIRPEISRTAHNMKLAGKGSSGGLYKKFLTKIAYAKSAVNFQLLPIEGLTQANYNKRFRTALLESVPLKIENWQDNKWDTQHSYRIPFANVREWYNLAGTLGIMSDIRSGMQRTVYEGVVSTIHKGCRLYVHPNQLNVNNFGLQPHMYNLTHDLQIRFIEFEKMYCKPGKYTGDCDPESADLIAWFKKKGWSKKLNQWKPMVRV